MWKMRGTMAFAAVALMLVAAPLEAQRRGPGGRGMGPNLDQQIEQLTEVLSLDEEQVVSVRAILELQQERRRELMGERRGNREAMRAAMMELQEETTTELAEVLSEEQMEKYREHVAQRRRGPGGGPGGGS